MTSPVALHPAVALLEKLINIDSTSERELEIGVFLESYLKGLSYTVERIPISKGSTRHNVYAYLGQQRETRVLLTSHMDTVPPHIPFSIEGDKIRGRGSCDDLGPMVAQILSVEELRAQGVVQEGDVGLLFVVGEEKGGPGMIAANDMKLSWEAVIFAEPTEMKLAQGHKGHFVFELLAKGRACHSGYPHLGSSAISLLLDVLRDLSSTTWPESDLLGSSTFNIGKVEGGEGYNILAPTAKALCAVRVAAGLADIKTKAREIISKYPGVEFKELFAYPETLLNWNIEGFKSAPVSYGTDVPRLQGSHKKALYGPGSILVAHGKDEFISVAELVESVAGYKSLTSHYLAIKKI